MHPTCPLCVAPLTINVDGVVDTSNPYYTASYTTITATRGHLAALIEVTRYESPTAGLAMTIVESIVTRDGLPLFLRHRVSLERVRPRVFAPEYNPSFADAASPSVNAEAKKPGGLWNTLNQLGSQIPSLIPNGVKKYFTANGTAAK